ncbi:hypothetical protein [Halospeciosus flavus]|uniref:Glycosyltransferase RgtA/B/C/D-like domain-containing protein n=3 Tax=Halospeciosus flavus TaxID=3032283 RepID=A0ABD5Z6G4_9EURY
MLALQAATMAAAALTGVILYRLLTEIHDRRVGIGAGIATAIVSPVAFWAAIPKRHALSALLVVITLYAFYRSRTRSGTPATRSHAVAYAAPVALAWTHAAEGAILFAALLAVDLTTAPFGKWSRRRLASVGSVFIVALIPMFLTNYLIAGNPLEPPRMLPGYDGTPTFEQLVGEAEGSTEGGQHTQSTQGNSGSQASEADLQSIPTTILALLMTALSRADLVQNQLVEGLTAITNPERLYHVFIRSGWLGHTSIRNNSEAITLTVLESLPLAGTLFVLPVAAVSHYRRKLEWSRQLSPKRATDVLAAAIAVAFALIYLPVLPLYAQITPRYLLPLFPLALYGVARLPAVRRALHERLLLWTYAVGVFIGGQLLIVWVALNINGLGEAVQLHAVLNLALAALLVAWIGAERVLNQEFPRTGACIIALCAAAGTLFVLFARIEYFAVGEGPVLPLVRELAQRLDLIS